VCYVIVMRSSDLLVTDPRPLMSLRTQIFDHDAGNEMVIDDVEFASAMRDKFGYKGPSHALSQLFAFLDTDHGGAIGFDELVSDQRLSTARNPLHLCGRAHVCSRASPCSRSLVLSLNTSAAAGVLWMRGTNALP
jgi:hypothetical protein